MKYFRVYSDENGESHFAEMEMRLAPVVLSLTMPALEASEPQEARQILFIRLSPDWNTDWHPAPAYQYMCVLSGSAEITVSDGDVRRFSAGDMVLLQDITGKGHQTQVVGEEEMLVAAVQLA
jgi:quercetin dioxygenase-like cupin family protein